MKSAFAFARRSARFPTDFLTRFSGSLLSALALGLALGASAIAQQPPENQPPALEFAPNEPIVAPGEAMPNERIRELQRLEIERIIEREVDEAVSRNFSWTIGLLNLLLLLLVAAPISTIALLWLFRSSAIAQLVDEVERRFGENLQDELQRELRMELRAELRSQLRDDLQADLHGELQRQMASGVPAPGADRPPTSAPPQVVTRSADPSDPSGPSDAPQPSDPPADPANAAADEQRLKEMVSMALSVRQTLTDAHQTLEDSVQIQERIGDRLEDLLDYHLDRAKQLERAEQYTEALAAYDKAIEIDPTAPLPHCARGALFVRLQRFDEAIAAFDRALEVRPNCAEARYGKACCFASVGYGDRAIEELQAALTLRPELRVAAQSDALLAPLRDREWFQTEVVG